MSAGVQTLLAAESAAYERLTACAENESRAYAAKVAALWDAVAVNRELRADDLVVCEVALTLVVSEAAAAGLLVQARLLRRHPDLYRLVATGALGVPHVQAVLDELGRLDEAVALAVEQAVLDQLADRTPGELRTLIRKAVITHDPDAAAKRREAAQRDRGVTLHPQPDGMAGIWALTGAVEGRRVDLRLAALAARHRRLHPDDPRTIGELRSDLLVAAVTGELDPHVAADAAGVQVVIQVPAAVATGAADAPAELAGYGPIDPDYVRTLLPDATLGREFVDRLTGEVLATADGTIRPETAEAMREALARMVTEPFLDIDAPESGYRPSARLADRVRRRDRTCEFGRCRVAAERCDLDHRDRWPDGPTSAANLGAKSRRHHRAKQAGWTMHRPGDGSVIWRSPSGRRYRRAPRSDPPPPIRFDRGLGALADCLWDSVLERAWVDVVASLSGADTPPESPPAPDLPDEPPF